MWPSLWWGTEWKILKQPYKQYQRTLNSPSLRCCTYGINKVCTIKQISSQLYKTAQSALTVKLRNPFPNIIFTSYVTYLTITIFNIHTQHYLNDINLDIYSKGGKGIPALSRLTKQSTCQIYFYLLYHICSFPFTNLQSLDKTEVLCRKKKGLQWHLLHVTSLGTNKYI